jgi:hypothetical protein
MVLVAWFSTLQTLKSWDSRALCRRNLERAREMKVDSKKAALIKIRMYEAMRGLMIFGALTLVEPAPIPMWKTLSAVFLILWSENISSARYEK